MSDPTRSDTTGGSRWLATGSSLTGNAATGSVPRDWTVQAHG
ncbi:hypothetical protein [Methylobacterium terrae]|nr:hypothetical protein [Methylobacterium terrae]